MNCPNCSTPIFPGAAFCLECGAKLPAARARVCTACGMELADGVHFCAGCGAPVAEEAVQAEVAVEEPVVIEPVAEETVEATEEIVAEEPVAEPEIHEQEEIIAEEIPAEGAVVVEEAAAWQPPAQPPQKGGFGRAFLSVLLCILIFILSVPTMLIGMARYATSMPGTTAVINQLSFKDIEVYDGQSVTDMISELMEEYDADFSKKDINKFMEETGLTEFIAQNVSEMMQDIWNADETAQITKAEVTKLVDSVAKYVEKKGEKISREEREEAVRVIMDSVDFESISKEAVEELESNLGGAYTAIRYAFSYLAIALLSLIVVLFSLLILKINKWRKARTLTYVGVTLLIGSIILCLPALAMLIVPDMIFGLLGLDVMSAMLIRGFVLSSAIVPAAVFGVGILMLIVRRIITVVCRKKAAKAC